MTPMLMINGGALSIGHNQVSNVVFPKDTKMRVSMLVSVKGYNEVCYEANHRHRPDHDDGGHPLYKNIVVILRTATDPLLNANRRDTVILRQEKPGANVGKVGPQYERSLKVTDCIVPANHFYSFLIMGEWYSHWRSRVGKWPRKKWHDDTTIIISI